MDWDSHGVCCHSNFSGSPGMQKECVSLAIRASEGLLFSNSLPSARSDHKSMPASWLSLTILVGINAVKGASANKHDMEGHS